MMRSIAFAAILSFCVTDVRAETSTPVQFGDLDISKPGDLKILEARVRNVADRMCRTQYTIYGAPIVVDVPAPELRYCVEKATEAAMRKVTAKIEMAQAKGGN